MEGAGLHRLVVPEDRVGTDPPLAVVDHRALVVRAEQNHRAVELEQLLLAEAIDLPIPRAVRVADHAPQVALDRKNLRHSAEVYLDEHGDRAALRLEDGLRHVAEILAVRLQRQRAVATHLDPVEIVTAQRVPRGAPPGDGEQQRRQRAGSHRHRREEVEAFLEDRLWRDLDTG